jgi:hypothetical protein
MAIYIANKKRPLQAYPMTLMFLVNVYEVSMIYGFWGCHVNVIKKNDNIFHDA